jgi:hypothetical protein
MKVRAAIDAASAAQGRAITLRTRIFKGTVKAALIQRR